MEVPPPPYIWQKSNFQNWSGQGSNCLKIAQGQKGPPTRPWAESPSSCRKSRASCRRALQAGHPSPTAESWVRGDQGRLRGNRHPEFHPISESRPTSSPLHPVRQVPEVCREELHCSVPSRGQDPNPGRPGGSARHQFHHLTESRLRPNLLHPAAGIAWRPHPKFHPLPKYTCPSCSKYHAFCPPHVHPLRKFFLQKNLVWLFAKSPCAFCH